MGLFKNKVGRPSNKTIKARRIIYSLLAVIVVVLIFTASYMLNSAFNLNKIKGASKTGKINTPRIEIAGANSSLKIGDESFESGNYINTDNIGEDLVSIGNNKKVKIRGRFPKLFYSGFWKNRFIFRVGISGENDTLIGQIQSDKITKETFEYELTITSDVKYIKADVVIGIDGYLNYPFIESITNVITTADASKVSVEYNSDSGFLIDNTGTILANGEYAYSIHAIIENGNNDTLYYRWFTFDGVNPETSKVSNGSDDNNECKVITRNTLVKGLLISTKSNAKNRSGMLKVYTSDDSCTKDNNAKTESLVSKSIKIKYDKNVKDFNKLYTSGTNDSIIVDKTTYAKGKLAHSSFTDNNLIFTNGDVKIEGVFTENYYKSNNYYVNYIAFSSDKNVVNKSTNVLIDKEKPTPYNIKITPEISSVVVKISYGKLRDNDANVVYSKTMKFAIKPTVAFTDSSSKNGNKLNLSKNADGNYVVNAYQNYNVNPVISNPSGATIYYRWFTFSDINAKGKTGYGSDLSGNSCKARNETKFSIGNPGLTVNKNLTKRSGKVVIYSSYDECRNDKTSNSASVGYGIANYIYVASSSNNNNLVVELKDKKNNPNSDGVYTAKEDTDYFPFAEVNNNNDNVLYYRWFTYNGLNAKEYRYDDEKCYVLNKGKVNVTGLERIEVSDYDRSGKLKVYSSRGDCINDTNGTGKKHISQAIINYKYNKKSTSSGNVKVDYTDENLKLLSQIIYAEAEGCSDAVQLGVGSVVLNRVKDKDYPNTIYDVIFQEGQYSPTFYSGNKFYTENADSQSVKNAKKLLNEGSQMPAKVIYQANFVQGSGIYKSYDTPYDTMYFCYK